MFKMVEHFLADYTQAHNCFLSIFNAQLQL